MNPSWITLHCADTINGLTVSVDAIRKDHIAKGYGDVGYHAIIQPSGELIQTRPYTEKGCHVAQANTGNVGICLAGKDQYPMAQLDAAKGLILLLIQIYPSIPRWGVRMHNEWTTGAAQGKTCPGMDGSRVRDWLVTHDKDSIRPYILGV
jgi:N-acetyl-anhydromuramyl-L-alanine amidase AmpD